MASWVALDLRITIDVFFFLLVARIVFDMLSRYLARKVDKCITCSRIIPDNNVMPESTRQTEQSYMQVIPDQQ